MFFQIISSDLSWKEPYDLLVLVYRVIISIQLIKSQHNKRNHQV